MPGGPVGFRARKILLYETGCGERDKSHKWILYDCLRKKIFQRKVQDGDEGKGKRLRIRPSAPPPPSRRRAFMR